MRTESEIQDRRDVIEELLKNDKKIGKTHRLKLWHEVWILRWVLKE